MYMYMYINVIYINLTTRDFKIVLYFSFYKVLRRFVKIEI